MICQRGDSGQSQPEPERSIRQSSQGASTGGLFYTTLCVCQIK